MYGQANRSPGIWRQSVLARTGVCWWLASRTTLPATADQTRRSIFKVKSLSVGATYGRDEWFALYRDDRSIDDVTWINNVKRGLFRLHPGHVSEGCITIRHNSDYAAIRNALMHTEPVRMPCMKSLLARGWIEVVANG